MFILRRKQCEQKKNCFVSVTAVADCERFIANIIIIENAKGQLPDVTQLTYDKNSETAPKTVSELKKLFERITDKGIAFCSEGKETKVKEETVTTVLVNENWFSDYKTEINGENISSKNIDNRDKVAIIGSSLALKLFLQQMQSVKRFALTEINIQFAV